MCDDTAIWNHNFYHEYSQQHARMTQWIQNLHQNLPQPSQSFLSSENHMCCHHNHQQNEQPPDIQHCHHIPQGGHHIPQHWDHIPQQGHHENVPQDSTRANFTQQRHHVQQQGYHVQQQGHRVQQQGHRVQQQGHRVQQQGHRVQRGHHVQHQRHSIRRHEYSRRNYHHDALQRSRSQTSIEYTSDNEDDDNEEEDDGELVLNVDAILAFRATKEVSDEEEKAESEESFELVDAVLNENFEFVELNDAGQLQKIYGKPCVPDAKGDFEYDKEARFLIYGDRSDRIAGLETSLEIMFDHINDLHQPVVYPHA